MSDNGTMKYLLTDHLGSTITVADATGTLLEQTRYMPFACTRCLDRVVRFVMTWALSPRPIKLTRDRNPFLALG
jgi:hypothetical protein